MATPEITLRGEVRDAVIGCVIRDIESSLDAVQAEYGTALQTFDCLDLLNARAHAQSLANAIELLARLVDPDRVDQEIRREREFAETHHHRETVGEEEATAAVDDGIAVADETVAVADGEVGADADDEVSGVTEESIVADADDELGLDRKTASNWIGETARMPEFLETPRANGRLNRAGAS